jgi:hypothetical protein
MHLYVLVHSLIGTGETMLPLEELLRRSRDKDVDFLRPTLNISTFCRESIVTVATRLVELIDERLASFPTDAAQPPSLTLVGHSIGALIVRKTYLIACGETDLAPFEDEVRHWASPQPAGTATIPARHWARHVDRIVLLAGTNRGWSISHHLHPLRAPLWWIGRVLARAVRRVTDQPALILQVERGSEFITQLRIQWIRMRQRTRTSDCAGGALTVQLLGSVDDIVSPHDNIDLISGRDFVYIDVPFSGHSDIVELGAGAPPERLKIIQTAICGTPEQLQKLAVIPSDEGLPPENGRVREMVWVMHGIRDYGFWTSKLARRVKLLAGAAHQSWATETSSYGYFPMLPFFVPSIRLAKVNWFMDQYTEAIAHYPNARFHFVGHSNGSYLVAKALEMFRCCRFGNVVLMGSVIRTDYDWRVAVERQQVTGRVLNIVATRDWVVALFPKIFQQLRLQDLGSAGHDGFAIAPAEGVAAPAGDPVEIRYLPGGHGAGTDEHMWDTIGRFVLTGHCHLPLSPRVPVPRRAAWVVAVGIAPIVVWLGIVGLLFGIAYAGNALIISRLPYAPDTLQFIRGAGATAYLFLLWKVVTRL